MATHLLFGDLCCEYTQQHLSMTRQTHPKAILNHLVTYIVYYPEMAIVLIMYQVSLIKFGIQKLRVA